MKRLLLFITGLLIVGALQAQLKNDYQYVINGYGGLTIGGTWSTKTPNPVKVTNWTLTGTTLNLYNGATQYSIGVAPGDQVVGIALADSSKTNGTGYTTPQDLGVATAVGFTITFDPTSYLAPADNTLYYYGTLNSRGFTTSADYSTVKIPFNCTLVGYSLTTESTAACSAETGTLSVRINNTTDVQLSDAVTWGVGGAYKVNLFSSAALNTSLTAGDRIEMKLLTPTWPATNATSVFMTTILYFKNR